MSESEGQTKDYSTATNPDPTLARYEEEIKELEKQIDVPGKEWQDLVDKAVRGETLTTQERNRKVELEREMKPLREQLDEKRSQAREEGKRVRDRSGKAAWPGQGE
jgi:predicted  nucleic acid-binding Zn-ribbon protein